MAGWYQNYELGRIYKEVIVDYPVAYLWGTKENHEIFFRVEDIRTEHLPNKFETRVLPLSQPSQWYSFVVSLLRFCDNKEQPNLLASFQFPVERNSEEEPLENFS
jgi:hypothetical protein